MALLDRLIRDARKAMQTRGHKPAPAQRSIGKSTAIIKCSVCNEHVHVICKPIFNEIQIAGKAVALNCNVATKSALQRGTEIHERIEREHYDEIRMDAVMGC